MKLDGHLSSESVVKGGVRQESSKKKEQLKMHGFQTLEPFATCSHIGTRAACIQKILTNTLPIMFALYSIFAPMWPFLGNLSLPDH